MHMTGFQVSSSELYTEGLVLRDDINLQFANDLVEIVGA